MSNVNEVGPGRILLDNGGPDGIQQLADAATGRPIGERVTGGPLARPRGPGSLLFARPLDGTGWRQLVTRLDLATGRQTLLGPADSDDERTCSASGRYLACTRGGHAHRHCRRLISPSPASRACRSASASASSTPSSSPPSTRSRLYAV